MKYQETREELREKLKILMLFRIIFTVILLGSTIFIQHGKNLTRLSPPLIMLYGIVIGIFFLSIVYALILPRMKQTIGLAYLQVGIDITVVSAIIYSTGGFSSIFSFLYLLTVIYASSLISRNGALFISALANVQYAILLILEFFQYLRPPLQDFHEIKEVEWTHVVYKIGIMLISSFAVALLSSFLADQTRETRKELKSVQDHLKRVEKMAGLGELAAGLAHEIKNPLASLLGAIQMIKEEMTFSPHQEKLVQIVMRETDRLNTLLGDFLFFSKPPTGRRERLIVDRALEEIIELFQKDRKSQNGIRITLDLQKNLAINMDPVHFRQIIWNLLLNASDSIEGSGLIQIRASVGKPGTVRIQIEDTGKGIAPENHKQIFDPFFTTKTSGTGLGLSIVHRLLEHYDGRLDIESEPGDGTLVTIRLNAAP